MKVNTVVKKVIDEYISSSVPIWLTGSNAYRINFDESSDLDIIVLYNGTKLRSFKQLVLNGCQSDILFLPELNFDHVLFSEIEKDSSALLYCCFYGKMIRDDNNRYQTILDTAQDLFTNRKEFISPNIEYIDFKYSVAKKFADDIVKPRGRLETLILINEFIGIFSELFLYLEIGWVLVSKIKARVLQLYYQSVSEEILALATLPYSPDSNYLESIFKGCEKLLGQLSKPWGALEEGNEGITISCRCIVKTNNKTALHQLIENILANNHIDYYFFKTWKCENYHYDYNIVFYNVGPFFHEQIASAVNQIGDINFKLEHPRVTNYKIAFSGGHNYLCSQEGFYFSLCNEILKSVRTLPFKSKLNNALAIFYLFFIELQKQPEIIRGFLDYLADSWLPYLCEVKMKKTEFKKALQDQSKLLDSYIEKNNNQISRTIEYIDDCLNKKGKQWLKETKKKLEIVIVDSVKQNDELARELAITEDLKYHYLFRRFLEQCLKILEIEIQDAVFLVPALKKIKL